ncbi:MAG: Methyltransferase [Berkelbacteria bacterium GW2011_GWA1_36_9]|uniref:Methyltransferase n=1 Tax=Berkelbacteria bacterium GW2011_GWA1_36_9 TaxID=1618331 RepID=A0A0G0IPD3_9BACT|nr:MAG: Methyltransferase [Berkelbacteria bacterium GW2011_GWA1_36_9]
MIIILYLLIPVSLIILIWQVSNLVSVFFGSPYVKARKNLIHSALKLAHLEKGEIFYDLGCGDGISLIEANKFGAKAVGFEISPYYYLWAKLRTLNKPNITVKYQNINNTNLQKADVVYCYLLPKFLEKLTPKFQRELKSGARLISVGFPIKFKKSLISAGAELGDKYMVENRKVYIYKIK